jgi:hypothetical protein
MHRRIIFPLASLFGLLILSFAAGCGGGGGGGGGSSNSVGLTTRSLAGTWKTIAIKTTSGQQANCPASFTLPSGWSFACGAADEITLNADGSIPNSGGLTFSVSGNHMVINYPAVAGLDPAYSNTYSVTLVGNVATSKLISSTSSDPSVGSDFYGTTTIYQRQ